MGQAVGIGHDDIEDPYYPWGRYNMLEIAFLSAHILGANTRARMENLFDMITERASRAIGATPKKIAEGAVADLLVHSHDDVHEVLNHHLPPKVVISRGKVVARSTSSTEFSLGR